MTDEKDKVDKNIHEMTEGQVGIAISRSRGHIIISFEKPVRWFALHPNDAITLGNSIVSYARKENKLKH